MEKVYLGVVVFCFDRGLDKRQRDFMDIDSLSKYMYYVYTLIYIFLI